MDKGIRFSGNERKYVDEVLSNAFGASETGTLVERLENAFAEKHNQKYAIGCNSGTSTLHAALEAFGVGPGDEVIVPALTVAMCGYAVWHCGGTPVYADVREDTFLIDPEDIERKITKNTKAIMVVHLYGLMCDMEKIMKIANKHNLYVLEDCAQCFLATDSRGVIAGTAGHVGSWSFENSKHLSCGDGGIVTTDDSELALFMRQFAGVGFKNITAASGKVRISKDKFQDPNWKRHNIMAYNYRLPEICAAVALAQVEKVEEFCNLRKAMAKKYNDVVEETGTSIIQPQAVPDGYINSYYTWACSFEGEKYGIKWQDFRKKHIENGGDGVYAAWQTVNNEPCFKDSNTGYGKVPIAEKLQKKLMHFTTNQMTELDMNVQADALRRTIKYFDK